VDEVGFRRWIDGYERAWRSPDPAALAELFTADVAYRHSPYAETIRGLEALARDWGAERDGPDEVFTMTADVLAVNADDPAGPLGVAHVLVRYGEPVRQEYRDLWLVRFAADGRAREFEEWPYWPGRGWSPSAPSSA
jgi:ketosteroid isomerase-like protein